MRSINIYTEEAVEHYLERINYRRPLSTDIETLSDLQFSHLLNVPFENLSIHLKESINLNYESLYDKIVNKRRGGFCYELNGLFSYLLRRIGFSVAMLSAGVANSDGVLGPDFDHLTLMVILKERWLVDVGFGDSFLKPLLIDQKEIQYQGEREYKIKEYGDYLLLEEKKPGSGWEKRYRFRLQSYELGDFENMCGYHQTSPESKFTQNRVCSKALPGGRVTLSGRRMIKTLNGDRHERVLKNDEEYRMVLKDEFGIVVQTITMD